MGGIDMGTSLIPIKGISQALIKSLKSSCDISDVAGLLTNGRTPEQRQIIADKLEIDRRYVDMWVKQAALWNVEGMTEDYAYLLIVTGIRCAHDLSRIDIDAAKSALKAASNAHPDYQYDDSELYSLRYAAENVVINMTDSSPVFDDNDPEPRHLFTRSSALVSGSQGSYGNVSKITVTVALADGQTYENTTSFPAIQNAGGGDPVNVERPSGRVDHPDGKGSYADSSSGTGSFTRPSSSNSSARPSGSNSGSKPSGRVDHPGMTGGSSSTGSSSSSNTGSSKKQSGSTDRRR
jgi:hypothetical protein